VLGGSAFALMQAPIWLRPGGRAPLPHSHADFLLRNGYASSHSLASLARGWRELLSFTPPDLILADHAPTALLAGRMIEAPTALIGMPLASPPRTTPFPELQPWNPKPEAELRAREETALASVNAVLRDCGGGPLPSLAALFEVHEDFICAFAELDCYGAREGVRYCGPTGMGFSAERMDWPGGAGSRLLAVLDASYWDLEPLLRFLGRHGLPTLASVRDVTAEQIERHRAANLRITGRPLDLPALFPECDAVIANGTLNVLHAALLAGKPVLILPLHLEQVLTGLRAAELGAALLVGLARDPPPDYGRLLDPLLSQPGFAVAAGGFADRHADYDPAASAAAIADRCEALLRR
jgi:hypothetical protein